MKPIYKPMMHCFLFILIASVLACADSESKLNPVPSGQTAVILNLGLSPEDPTAHDDIWNRIRKIFMRDAVAQTAPANFSSISVTVTGPDISAIQQSFPPAGPITLNVPAGNVRRFDVMATVASGDPSAAFSFSGITTSNLPEGATVNLPVLMLLNETKIVVPDLQNNRIVTIDNLAGANWNARTTLGSSSVSQPTDVSFDSRGRIYVSLNSTNGIIRADDPNGTNATAPFGAGAIQTVAVDRNNNILYYASSGALYKNNLNGTSQQALTNFAPITTIRGIDVNANGMLFIVGSDVGGIHYITLYNPNANSGNGGTVSQYGPGALNTPWDVLSVPPYIYVANFTGTANNQILRFSLDSNNAFITQGNYGTQGTTTNPGIFYGARRFLAIRNDSLIVADSDSLSSSNLVSLADIAGSNWTVFGTHGTGTFQFKLWAPC